MKDIVMAKHAKVTDVWAKYGLSQSREEYELLRKVTHWTSADVEREKRLRDEEVKPTHTLESGFSEIMALFEFDAFVPKSHKDKVLAIEIWKKIVDVQQHFNDLELRIRNYSLTVLAAMLGFAAYATKEDLRMSIFNYKVSVASALLFSSGFLWLAFYFMDRFWYHRLLYGAVNQGRFIENRWKPTLPEMALTESIGKYSPLKISRLEIHTPRKIDMFYAIGLIFLLVLTFFAQHIVRSPADPNSAATNSSATPHGQVVDERGSEEPAKPSTLSPTMPNSTKTSERNPETNEGKNLNVGSQVSKTTHP